MPPRAFTARTKSIRQPPYMWDFCRRIAPLLQWRLLHNTGKVAINGRSVGELVTKVSRANKRGRNHPLQSGSIIC